jgi:hypothetical protein
MRGGCDAQRRQADAEQRHAAQADQAQPTSSTAARSSPSATWCGPARGQPRQRPATARGHQRQRAPHGSTRIGLAAQQQQPARRPQPSPRAVRRARSKRNRGGTRRSAGPPTLRASRLAQRRGGMLLRLGGLLALARGSQLLLSSRLAGLARCAASTASHSVRSTLMRAWYLLLASTSVHGASRSRCGRPCRTPRPRRRPTSRGCASPRR